MASLLLFCVLFCATSVVAQDTEVHKTRSSATIGGIKYYLHTVEKGQTLFAIAKCYGIDVNDLVIENPDAIDGIKPGQVLKIPFEKKKLSSATMDTTNYFMYKVEAGQTLYSISKEQGVDAEKLKILNPELKDGLKAGQMLKIPSNKPKTATATGNTSTLNTVTTATPPASNGSKPTSSSTQPATNTQPTTNNQQPTTTQAADHTPATAYKGEKKSAYNIAFFLPFHANEANALDADKLIHGDIEFSNKTDVALHFYEGALLALDSLKKEHFNAKVFVYDIDDTDSMNMMNILRKPELKTMDLMIGPLYGSSFLPFAKFAKENGIAIVSPFTQVNKILFNNPYVCKVSPSLTLQLEQMANFVIDSFAAQNILVVNNGASKEASFYNTFKTAANKALSDKGHPAADTVREVLGFGGAQAASNVIAALNPGKTNIVVLTSNNQSYVTEFIGKLNQAKDKHVILFGMPNWNNYDNLDPEYLNNLALHTPANNFVDYSDPKVKQFIKDYRDKYLTEPEAYSYQGFDVTYYFLSMLQHEGSAFLNVLPLDGQKCIETNFSFRQYPPDSGFENKFVYILKYQDYKLVKAN